MPPGREDIRAAPPFCHNAALKTMLAGNSRPAGVNFPQQPGPLAIQGLVVPSDPDTRRADAKRVVFDRGKQAGPILPVNAQTILTRVFHPHHPNSFMRHKCVILVILPQTSLQ
jgi:hypothetical protein